MTTLRIFSVFFSILFAAGFFFPVHAGAKPPFLKNFKQQYPTSKVSTHGCKLCHDEYYNLNVHGESVQKNILTDGTIAWMEVEKIDSDGDGYSNIEEYVSGTNPADREDKPTSR